jgi:hypothetical protein
MEGKLSNLCGKAAAARKSLGAKRHFTINNLKILNIPE